MQKRLLLVLSVILCAVANSPSDAKTYSLGTEASTDFTDSQVVSNPQPIIPSHLHEECFKSCCIARFFISPEGTAKVKLLSSSGNEEIDSITLSTLRRWKFKPAMLDGKPVASSRKIKVEFHID